jgi:Plasmid pRiA4b ORF-3-like protein
MLDPKRPLRTGRGSEIVRLPHDVMRLRIVLIELVPPVWRRLRLRSDRTLRQLHEMLRCVTGWDLCEAHRFRVGDRLYGRTSENSLVSDSRWVTLADVAASGVTSFRYELTEHSGWEHEIRIEGTAPGELDNQVPVCLDGDGSWPPESCGGIDAYVYGADVLESDGHFDREAVNRALARLR